MTITDILDRLNRVRKCGDGWTALCPAHPDKNASLSVGQGEEGRVLLHCFFGCTVVEICEALNIQTSDLFSGSNNGNSHRESKPAPQTEPIKFSVSDEDVDRMRAGLIKSQECQQFIQDRGISLRIAVDLRWGFVSATDPVNTLRRPALVIPHYRHDGKLAGIKFRAIGEKLFAQVPGSATGSLYGAWLLDRSAGNVMLLEGFFDTALALTHGFNAAGMNFAGAKLNREDFDALRSFERVYLVGDQDPAGQKCMDSVAASLPVDQVIRVRLRGVKDVGELYAKAPNDFERALKGALRVADIQRSNFTWHDLETESELLAGGTGKLPYLVDGLIPLDDCTMFAGKEGSLKTLLALYIGKCVANGTRVFGHFPVIRKPVLYLDAENHTGTHQVYLRFFESIGSEEIRFRTLRYGVPSLTDAALLRICGDHRPLLILDSLIRFGGKRDRDTSEMTELMEQIARLVTAGATVLLIHHTRRSDEEEYANSFAIGATVAFWYAIVKDDTGLVKRVRMIHKKARASVEIHRDLLAFPSILDRGMFELDADTRAHPLDIDLESLVEFVKQQPEQACLRETIKKRPGRRAKANLELLERAITQGLLVVRNDKKVAFPNSGTSDLSGNAFPFSGTSGNVEDET